MLELGGICAAEYWSMSGCCAELVRRAMVDVLWTVTGDAWAANVCYLELETCQTQWNVTTFQ